MRIVLFDIDGTLLLTNRGGSSAIQHALQQEFGLESPSTDIDFCGRTDRALLAEILRHNAIADSDEHFQRLRLRYTALLPRVLEERGGEVLPGALELLSVLREKSNLRCYAMTGNLAATAVHKLQHFGLDHYFDGVFGGDDDAHRDDLARRTAAAIRANHGELARSNMTVIGDTPADIQCGHAVGAEVIAVCSGQFDRESLESNQPIAVFDDLSDVQSIVDLIHR